MRLALRPATAGVSPKQQVKPASEAVQHARQLVAESVAMVDELDIALASCEEVARHMLDDLAAYAERVKAQRK